MLSHRGIGQYCLIPRFLFNNFSRFSFAKLSPMKYSINFLFWIAFFGASVAFQACNSGENSDQNNWVDSPSDQSELAGDQHTQGSLDYNDMAIPELPFELEEFIPSDLHDSLLTDLIVRIYRRPPGSNQNSRFEDRFRSWYVNHLPRFDWMAHQFEDDNHFFLMKRPARNIHGHVRTVGGIFQLNSDNKITYFQEVFNTPMLPEHEARVKGALIFKQWKETGHIGQYFGNSAYVEFPDERTYYNPELLEWSYDFNRKDPSINEYLPEVR